MSEYIEREALLAAYDAAHEGAPGRARKLIAEAPVADVAPVRHGRWVEKEEPYFDVLFGCSACGEEFCFIEGNPSDNLYKYCPNCGARMDGE